MKKLLKFMGLLLATGLMFTSCLMSPGIDAEDITLTDGTWTINYKSSASYTYKNVKYTDEYTSSYTMIVANEKGTVTGGSYGFTYVMTLPDDSQVQSCKSFYEKNYTDATVTVKGKTVTVKKTTNYPASDFEGYTYKVKNLEANLPKDAVIKRNLTKSEYKATYTDKYESDDLTYDIKHVVTYKKK